jgi:hypothetical protein
MIQADDRILEHLRDHGKDNVEDMAARRGLPDSAHEIRERCRVLAQAEYVEPDEPGSDWVEITSDGLGYLDERMRADAMHPQPTVDWRSYLRPPA